MTAPDYRTATQDDQSSGLAQDARDRGKEVGEHARDAAAGVKDTAAERAKDVAGEARQQAQNLAGQTKDTLVGHADEQASRLTDTLEQLAEELRGMANSSDQNGVAGKLVSELADRTEGLAQRMRGRSSTDLLDDLRYFARRRPGAFLAGAAGLGLVAGRLGRGLKDASSSDTGQDQRAWSGEPYPGDYSTAGIGIGEEPLVGDRYADTTLGRSATTGYESGYGTGTTGTGYGTTGAGYGSGYAAGEVTETLPPVGGTAGELPAEPGLGGTALDDDGLDVPAYGTEHGAHVGGEHNRPTGSGSGYGA